MKNFSKVLIFGLFASLLMGFSGVASAYYPTLNVQSANGGGTTISVMGGQPNATVTITYTPSGSNLTASVTGVTDYSGNFTTMINSAIGSQVNATVGGQQVYANGNGGGYYGNGCSYYGCSVGGLTLSQTSLSLNVGQTANVTATYQVYGYSNNFYISSNSNSSVASASVSGSQITVYGITSGSTTISVCANGNGSCASLYVTVSGYNNGCSYYGCGTGAISLSQTSVSLNIGQSTTVTAYNNNGNNVYISSNSNSSVVSASVSGNTINLFGSASGSSLISICSSNVSSCVSLYVTVSGSVYNGSIYFSPSSLSINAGQASTVSIYNNGSSYGNYYVSSNSNSAVASASVSGSSLYVSALTAGSASIVVCQSANSSSCATLYVTVTGVLGANTNLWFSPGNPSLYVGQSLAVSINSSSYSTAYPYNSAAYYISSNTNPNVVSANVSGTVLNLYASQNGTSNITVCNTALGFCGMLYVSVGGSSSYGSLSLSQTSLNIPQGTSMIVSAYNVPSVYVSSNSNPGIVSASASVNQVTFYGAVSGNSTVVLCGVNSSQCATVYVTVNGYNNGSITLGQYSLGLNVGQSATVNVSGNGGYGYYISSNSNPGVVSASFNGSVINIYAIASGSSTLVICQNNANSCPSLYVTVGGGTYYNNGNGLQYPGGGVLGASTYANGQLISEGSTVYIVYKNTKTAFANSSVFFGLGYSFGNVLQVGSSNLVNSSHTVTTIYSSHPWGSWVKNSGNTVYFVHDQGLIPVPDWNTFLNNGGQSNMIVSANTYDFRLPILSPMVSSDPRLQ
jgi:Bacterial Ig-like domain (group 2)